MKENNYTLEELEELFSTAEVEAIADLDSSMKESLNEKQKEDTGMFMFSFSLQNMMAINTVKEMFFKKLKEESDEQTSESD